MSTLAQKASAFFLCRGVVLSAHDSIQGSDQQSFSAFSIAMPSGHKSGKAKKSGKSRSSSRSPSRKSGKKKSGSRSRSASPGKGKKPADLLSPDAMVNGYYIAHDAPQFLSFRGFGWDGASKGKKKKGKGKKKKK